MKNEEDDKFIYQKEEPCDSSDHMHERGVVDRPKWLTG